jgi:hypothetical protein
MGDGVVAYVVQSVLGRSEEGRGREEGEGGARGMRAGAKRSISS